MTSDNEDLFQIDPSRFPKKIDIDLPPTLIEQLEKHAAATGRSLDELILEILDRHIDDY
jgi:hypothetical protein